MSYKDLRKDNKPPEGAPDSFCYYGPTGAPQQPPPAVCMMGATHRQAIQDLERRVNTIERKMDWFMMLLVTSLGGIIINIVLTVGNGF